MFNMSSAIHNANPLVSTKPTKTDSPITVPSASILNNPKQKLTTQFKRAITAMKHRTDSPQMVHIEKILDSPILPTFIDDATRSKDNPEYSSQTTSLPVKSQSYVQIKSPPNRSLSNQLLDTNTSSTATIVAIDTPSQAAAAPSIARPTHPSSPSARLVKQSLQQIHSSILQTMHQPQQLSSISASPSTTLSPTSTSSRAAGTGEVAILETILWSDFLQSTPSRFSFHTHTQLCTSNSCTLLLSMYTCTPSVFLSSFVDIAFCVNIRYDVSWRKKATITCEIIGWCSSEFSVWISVHIWLVFLFAGYYRLLREGRAPMASPDPLSITSEEGSNTPDFELLWLTSDDETTILSMW